MSTTEDGLQVISNCVDEHASEMSKKIMSACKKEVFSDETNSEIMTKLCTDYDVMMKYIKCHFKERTELKHEKVLLEKILYSCHGVKHAFVLIRQKKSKKGTTLVNEKNRFEDLLDSKIFQRVRDERPSDLNKIIPVWGDLSKPGLGMSPEVAQNVYEKVNVVFHCAATVRFNEPLKVAVEINLLGTKNVMDVFKNLKNPKSFIHLSTAYANCQRNQIDEIVYPPPVQPDFLLDAYENLGTEALDCLTGAISEGRPNTYTVTKAVAESYVEQHSNNMPVAIVRPSIVGNSHEEPFKGWGDTHSILTGVSYAVGMGLIHNLPMNGGATCDVIPVDFVTNIMLAVAWHTASKRVPSKKVPVFNIVSGFWNPLSFERFMDLGLSYVKANPSTFVVNYPYVTFTRNRILLTMGKYYNHYLPALAMDLVRLFKGKNTKYLNTYRKFFNTLPLKTFFMEREFNFKSDNVAALSKQLSDFDRKTFNFDVQSLEWPIYLENMFDGIRKFLIPNENENLQVGRQKLKRLYIQSLFFNVSVPLAVLFLAYFSFVY